MAATSTVQPPASPLRPELPAHAGRSGLGHPVCTGAEEPGPPAAQNRPQKEPGTLGTKELSLTLTLTLTSEPSRARTAM